MITTSRAPALDGERLVAREIPGSPADKLAAWLLRDERMRREISRHGGEIRQVAFCPHRPEEDCSCRKPRPGLLRSLAQDYAVELPDSFLIGDALSDLEAGQAVGCQTILVLTGRGQEQLQLATARGRNGFLVAADLSQATDLVLSRLTTVV